MQKMHDIPENSHLDEKNKAKLDEIEQEYNRIVFRQGAVIKKIIRIERKEDTHYLFEDADFSSETITRLIEKGDKDTGKILEEIKKSQR